MGSLPVMVVVVVVVVIVVVVVMVVMYLIPHESYEQDGAAVIF
jgi:hypothetical protein